MNKIPKQEVLLATRHFNKARKLLGEVYRTKTEPPNEYPEVGAVEVTNALVVVAHLLAEVEHLEKKRK